MLCGSLHLAVLETVHRAGRLTHRQPLQLGKFGSIELTRVVVEVKAHLPQRADESAHSGEKEPRKEPGWPHLRRQHWLTRARRVERSAVTHAAARRAEDLGEFLISVRAHAVHVLREPAVLAVESHRVVPDQLDVRAQRCGAIRRT